MIVRYAAHCVAWFALLRCVNPGNLDNTQNLDLGTDLAKQRSHCGSNGCGFPAMTQSLSILTPSKDPRTVELIAKDVYRELRRSGFSERDVLSLAGELLSLITHDVRGEATTED